MSISVGSHAEVVKNNISKDNRLSTLAQNIEKVTNTTSSITNEAAEASEKKKEQDSSNDSFSSESKQTSSNEDNLDESNIPADEGTKEPVMYSNLTSAYFGDLPKFPSTIKMEETKRQRENMSSTGTTVYT